jgi:hypothetical protein
MRWPIFRVCLGLCLAVVSFTQIESPKKIIARVYDSGFADAHDTYNGMGTASDGKIYYVLCSERYDAGAKLYSFDPAARKIAYAGDLTEAAGEKNLKAIVQGKSHSQLIQSGDKLYFATHIGYYTVIDGTDHPGVPPAGYKPYLGGHFLSYDLNTHKFENLAIVPRHEGVQTFTMDIRRKRLYALTWPTSHFISYDLNNKALKDLGPVSLDGELGKGPRFRTICRSLQVDPRDGSVYFTTSDGDIYRYVYSREAVQKVQGDDLRKDYFGVYNPSSPGHMGYNWRQTFFRDSDGMIYGVHGNSGYLFRFDPRNERVEVLERITSEPSKRSGMFDQFSYGYLGFTLGPDKKTIYYLTGGPIYQNGRRVAGKRSTTTGEAKGEEDLHLVTYHIPSGRYRDHGAVFLPDGQRPLYVNSIAVGSDRSIYTLCRITKNGHTRTDLISIPAVGAGS